MPEEGVEGSSSVKPASRPSGLFVFGDSDADTGNRDPTDPSLSSTWKFPYGTTWSGIPTGRFSDGRVLTDYFGKHCIRYICKCIYIDNELASLCLLVKKTPYMPRPNIPHSTT